MPADAVAATLPPDASQPQYVPGRMVSGLPPQTVADPVQAAPMTLDGQATVRAPVQATPIPLASPQGQAAPPAAPAQPESGVIPDYLQPLFQKIRTRESVDKNVLYGGAPVPPGNVIPGAIGPTGQQTHAFNKYQMEPDTWNRAAQAARDWGFVLDHNNPNHVDWAALYTARTDYKERTHGRDLDDDAKNNQLQTWALVKTWPTLGGPGGASQAGTDFDYHDIVARSDKIMKDESTEIARLTAEADKADPDSQLRHQRMQQAMDRSERLSQQFEDMSRHPPTETPLDMMQNFGSLATVIALAGGLLAKRPLTAALNAAGSAMRAQQEGNHEQAQRAYKVWQDQTDLISKALNFQNQEINQIMEDRRISESERHDKMEEHLRLYGMQQALEQWYLGNYVDVGKLIAAQPKMALELEQMRKHMALMQAQTEALHGGKGWQILTEPVNRDEAGNPIQYRYNPNTGEATTLTGEPYTPSGAEKLAPGYAPRSAPAMYMQAYMRDHPHALPSELSEAMGEYRRIQALETGFASGGLGRQVVALNTVADHLLLVKEYAEALNNGQIPRANAIANQISKETGGPAVTNFDAGRDIMADEVVRLLTTTGGTEADRQGMQSRISSAFSPAQFAGVINVFERFVHGRFEALQQQYAQGDTNRIKRFRDDILTDKARQVYGGATSAESSASSYSSPADVEQAFMTGKVTKEQAEQILIEKFGAKQ